MTKELKKMFINMPIDVTNAEYMALSKTLYASLKTMLSKNETIHIIDVLTKKVYLFDVVTEIETIKSYAQMKGHHLLNVIAD